MKRALVFLALFSLAVNAHAAMQCVIQGIVDDGSGLPLPGVTISVSAPGQPTRSAVTDANGAWSIRGLAAGTYTVSARLAGFTSVRAIVVAKDGKAVDVALHMTAAAMAEAITVTASAAYSVDGLEVEPRPNPQYAHFDEHGFVDTKKERTSTFAIDVDRASYANVRRFLTGGLVPPADAVRVEEMINYFAYDYPQPKGKEPFAVVTEVASCPWNAANRLVRIGVQGRNLEQWKMAPNNLVFLIDVSGSMSPPERLPLLQGAFRVLVEQLRAEDRVAIVVYAGAAGLVLPSTSGADKETILAALDALHSGGSTAGGEGIELAYEVARESYFEEGNNRVILATDGDFNVGVSNIAALEKLIEKKRRSGIFLSVLGVGDDNLQDALMEMLADKGNGNYAVLDSPREAEKVFRQELTGTLVTIAKDVKIQIEFDPAKVASYRQIGYENRALENKDFDDDDKDAGELGAGHSVTALYEIALRPQATGEVALRPQTPGEIAALRLRYKEPRAWRSTLMTAAIVDHGTNAQEASRDFQFAAAVAQMGMLLRHSAHAGTATWDNALALAKIARGEDLDGTRTELVELIELAKRVE